ncbi:MAG: hypothetical protein HY812_10795 [Planctomycetes bacterium]|nr:hypothetical protein [Planctomycetota bacterium]
MTISSIDSGSSILDKYGYLQTTAADDTQDMFLNLLVAQLSNQNPLEPMENDSLIQQMSAFATVEQIEQLSSKMTSLIAIEEIVAGQNAFTQSASLVGKVVEYTDEETGETRTGLVRSVHLDGDGLQLDVDGTKIPMNLVTGIIGDASQSDGDDDSTGDGSDDDNQDE